MAETFLTRKGYEKLRGNLVELKKRRQDLAKEIAEAAEKGDLKENAEYHAAKEEQQKIQKRLGEVEDKLRSARLLDEVAVQTGEIRIGSTAKIKDVKTGDEFTYTLVDAAEADFSKGLISVLSPMAEGLLGHKEKETVNITLPAGQVTFNILKVSRDI